MATRFFCLFIAFLVAASLVSSSAATVAVGSQPGLTTNEIVIGSCTPFSGLLKMRGPEMTHGANSYFNFVNEQHGVNGRTIKLVTCDDAFDPSTAIQCFNSCLKDKVFAGAFFVGSAVTVKYLRMAELTKMPLVGFDVGPPALCEVHPTAFNLRPCYGDEVRMQVQALWAHNKRKIALVFQNDAFGACVRQALETAMHEHNSTVAAEASCSRTLTDVDAAYDQVKAAEPDAIIAAINTAPLKQFIKRRDADHLKVVCTTLSSMEDALMETGSPADGFFITEILPPLDSRDKAVQLFKTCLKKYYPQDRPGAHGLECFLNAMVLVEGLRLSGAEPTQEKLVNALESIHDFDLGLPPAYKVNFSKHSHVGWNSKVISLRVMHNGKLADVNEQDWKE